MPHPLRFHVLLLPNVPWPELRTRGIHLESLGVEVAALADHVADWANPTDPWHETWTTLPALAEATSTVRLSTVVTQIPLRNPVMLARQVLTVDHISGGRVELGLGTGIRNDPSCAMVGLPNWESAERASRFAEYIALVDRLLTQDVTSHTGAHYAADAAVTHRPVQRPRPPLLVAALGPRMIRLAARYADIWNSLSFLPTFDDQLAETRHRVQLMDAACADIDRDPATLRRSYTLFDPTARANGGALSYYRSPDVLIDQVTRLVALGISDIGLYYPLDPAQLPAFEDICLTTLPSLRATYPSI